MIPSGKDGGASADRQRVRLSRENYDAIIFDLDGVIVDTARVHAAAWKAMFDDFLQTEAPVDADTRPFDLEADYRPYVDGRPRYEGVQAFLASRGIMLPWGDPGDPHASVTVCGLGNRKNDLFRQCLARDGAEQFPVNLAFVRRARALGFKLAVVTSSCNCEAILETAGLGDLFDAQVDGNTTAALRLRGKPEPDTFLHAAKLLQVDPARVAVVEDAVVGVAAGRDGHFGYVIGLGTGGHAHDLAAGGADVTLPDLSLIALDDGDAPIAHKMTALPSALAHLDEIARRIAERPLAILLDYDGTLTPIVPRPEEAVLCEPMRATLRALSDCCFVAVVSGRDTDVLHRLMGVDSVVVAGDHGLVIETPEGPAPISAALETFPPMLDRIEEALHEKLDGIAGALVERKRFSVAVHYRKVAGDDADRVVAAAEAQHAQHPELRIQRGKKVVELVPDIEADKGTAVKRLLDAAGGERPPVPLYIGDDITDEDAFRAIADVGIGIVVLGESADRTTLAEFSLADPNEVRALLIKLVDLEKGRAS